MKRAIAELLIDLNNRPVKKLPGCRRSARDSLDAPALRPLPAQRYAIGRRKTAKVNIDDRVEFEGHYCSVPHRLVGAKIDVRVTANPLKCVVSNRRVAGHAVSTTRGGFTKTPEHMPASQRAQPEVDAGQAHRLGSAHRREHGRGGTLQRKHRPHPEQGCRARLACWPGAPHLGRSPGGRLHACHDHPRTRPAQRHQHPQVRL